MLSGRSEVDLHILRAHLLFMYLDHCDRENKGLIWQLMGNMGLVVACLLIILVSVWLGGPSIKAIYSQVNI